MAGKIDRFLTNAKKNAQLSKLISAIGRNFPSYALGNNTPLPNQALETAKINGKNITLYFDKSASLQLNILRNIAYEKTKFRLKNNKEDKPIEFICKGYLDFSGDIVIHEIVVPAEQVYRRQQKNTMENILKHTPCKDIKLETMSQYYDYLRETKLGQKGSIGYMPVALLGTTRPVVSTQDKSQYCPRFSEIANSIVPANIEFEHKFLTGSISISPKYMERTPKGYACIDGSLECILTEYKQNSNNTVTPISFTNVTQCQQMNANEKLEAVAISKSQQPLDGLPLLDREHSRR